MPCLPLLQVTAQDDTTSQDGSHQIYFIIHNKATLCM